MATTTESPELLDSCFVPDWPLPRGVRALQTTRCGGASQGPWLGFNLGDHVGDDAAHVAANRARLSAALPAAPRWLKQVHGTTVCDADMAGCAVPEADAALSRRAGVVCAVMTADCLPLLVCDRAGTVVAAAHAGWRGLRAGVIEATIAAMRVAPTDLTVWLGPAIGPAAFEVGGEVRETFVADDPAAAEAFVAGNGGRWLGNLYLLARQRLMGIGVADIHGGTNCTVADPERYFSYRRDGITGRMASLIWLDPSA